MAAEVVVPVRLDLMIQDAVKDAKGAADKISKELDGISGSTKSIQNLGKAFGAFFVVDLALEGITKLADKVGDFVKEASDAERVAVGLSNALKVSGSYSQDAVENFRDLADELAKVTKFDDDLILSQVKVAKQFNTSNAEAEKLIRASVQLATVLDVDLTTATNLLGKTLDGTAGRLNETIPGLRKFTKEALVSGAAIDYVLKRFGGTAEADLKTFDGAIAQLTKNSKNFDEAVGNIIVKNPTFIAAINAAADAFLVFQSAIENNSEAIKAFLDSGLKTVVDLFGIFIQTVKALDDVLTQSLVPLNIFARTLQFIFGGLGNLLTLNIKGLAESLNIIGNVSKDNATQKKAFEDRAKFYDSITESAAKASVFLDQQLTTTQSLNKLEGKRADNLSNTSNAQERLNIALKEERKAFQEQIAKFGQTNLQQIEIEKDAALKKNLELFGQTTQLIGNEYKIRKEFEDKYQKQRIENLRSLVTDPAAGLLRGAGVGDKLDSGEIGATGVGVLSNALKGKQGAVTLLSGVAEAFGKAFLGIPGLGELFGLLAQGPEQVKAFVKEFVESVPEIIQAVIESVPAIIDGIIAALPKLIENLIKALPKIVVALARTFILYLPDALVKGISEAFNRFFSEIGKGAERFIDELLKGAGQFIDRLIQGISDGIGKIFDGLNPFSGSSSGLGGLVGGIGNVVGGIVGGIGSIFGFKGGPAIDGGGFQKSGGQTGSAYGGPMTINLQVGQKQLASTILDLNRQGFRTA